MATKISWADETWNPVLGCSKVSAGCANCYAVPMAWRLGRNDKPMIARSYAGLVRKSGGKLTWSGELRLVPHKLFDPLTWRRPRVVFVNSMGDLFHENAPFEIVDRVFAVMRLAPWHAYIILTKRPEVAHDYVWSRMGNPEPLDAMTRKLAAYRELDLPLGFDDGLARLWMLGVSVEDQAHASERVAILKRIPAPLRAISAEPLLEVVDLRFGLDFVDLVIVGGESGPGARRMPSAAPYRVQVDCERAGVAFWFKQWGGAWRVGADDELGGRRCFAMPPAIERITSKGKG